MRKAPLLVLFVFLAIGCQTMRSGQTVSTPVTQIYMGQFKTMKNGVLYKDHPAYCSISVVRSSPQTLQFGIAIRNDGSNPLQTNSLADSISIMSADGNLYDLSISKSSRGYLNFYKAEIVNPGVLKSIGNLSVDDPGILNVFNSTQNRVFLYKLGLSNLVCAGQFSETMESLKLTKNQASNLVANVNKIKSS